ncbi:F-box protein At5g49610-like isoform X2 [Silene latifolia]
MTKRVSQAMDLCLLNNDIPFDVLSRLPADKLLQLKRVSKQWQNFITDPDFQRIQMNISPPISISGYFFQERYEYSEVDVDKLCYIPLAVQKTKIYQNVLDFLPEKVTILASSNGLICCRSCNPSADPFLYVCNPANKEFVKLKWDNFQRRDQIAFSFEPHSTSLINAARDYKLVKVFETVDLIEGKEELFFGFGIYDWEKKKWVKSKELCQSEDSLCSNKRVILKGILYCLTDGFELVTFDIDNELSFMISLPLSLTDNNGPEICLGESEGVLHCVVVSTDALQVWALVDRFTSKWDLRDFISFEAMEEKNPEYFRNLVERVTKFTWMHLLAFKEGNLFLRVSNSAFSLEIQSRNMRLLCSITDLGRQVFIAPTVIPYSISLAPLANY